jgi:hypothetical protein
MKRALAILLLLVTPSVCPGTVLESDPPAALTIVEPALLAASAFVTVYNGRFIEKRSLLWSCLGMAIGTMTLASSTSEVMPAPALTVAFGAASFFVSLARLPRPMGVDTPPRRVGLEMNWRTAQLVVRF